MPDEAPETPADAAAPDAAPPVVAPVADVIPAPVVDAPPALAPVAPTLPPPSPAAAEVSAPVVAVEVTPAVPVAPVEVTPPYLVVAGARHPITITRRGAGAVEVSVALPDGSASAVAESERAALSLLGRIHGEVVT